MKILIKGANVLQPDYSTGVADIAITDDVISAVGEIPGDFAADYIIEGKDRFAVPGLVNAHTHASMTLLRSYADDMELMDWLNNRIWPVEAKMVEICRRAPDEVVEQPCAVMPAVSKSMERT